MACRHTLNVGMVARSLFILLTVFLASCALVPTKLWNSGPVNNFVVEGTVNGIADPTAGGKRTYFMAPGDERISIDDLQFREYAAYMDRALAETGYVKAASQETADLIVVMHYGIGDPQTITKTRNIPIFGQTGVSSSTTYGTVSPTYGGGASYSGTTYNTPTYGITGMAQRTTSETVYTRFIMVSAYDWQTYKAENREVQVWRTTVTSVGPTPDLRLIFPVMLGGALPALTKDTGRMVEISIGDQEPPVLLVRGQQAPKE